MVFRRRATLCGFIKYCIKAVFMAYFDVALVEFRLGFSVGLMRAGVDIDW